MKIPYLQSSSSSFIAGPLTKGAILLGSLALGQWFFTDLIHVPGGGLGVLVLGAGIFWLSKPLGGHFEAPTTVQGWVTRCQKVLEEFKSLDGEENSIGKNNQRLNILNEIINRSGPQNIAFVSSKGVHLPDRCSVESAICGPNPLNLSWSSSLPLKDNAWIWPKTLFEQDLLVYVLPLPLMASDLLWLEKVPNDQPSWLMVDDNSSLDWPEQLKALQSQLPHRWTDRILRWNNTEKDLTKLLTPVRRVLKYPQKNIDLTRQRVLAKLHSSWQADLESLRRAKFRNIQQRTQWVVAGAVFASPVPTTDLLAISVANGLMIQEMAQIWSCSWGAESLQLIARQLAGAAVAQGVVEWSGHALLGVAKLHGSSWLAAGTMQALSAAYLTRVVGRSMADWMALNNGVSEPDLEALKKQAPKLIANAARQERLDWTSFLKQAGTWINDRNNNPSIETTYLEAT
ncbi:YcjF family protein [Prochlorococcus sp. MIT 1307]|uniref:YcjF family protein n=1 Tax=Prochlorococcus sp. MIT 1307 TaxID=3096219 RepID=UPI002A756867|nr:YcjF family protein [Prochlorococcus sp. MIT 1307]